MHQTDKFYKNLMISEFQNPVKLFRKTVLELFRKTVDGFQLLKSHLRCLTWF